MVVISSDQPGGQTMLTHNELAMAHGWLVSDEFCDPDDVAALGVSADKWSELTSGSMVGNGIHLQTFACLNGLYILAHSVKRSAVERFDPPMSRPRSDEPFEINDAEELEKAELQHVIKRLKRLGTKGKGK